MFQGGANIPFVQTVSTFPGGLASRAIHHRLQDRILTILNDQLAADRRKLQKVLLDGDVLQPLFDRLKAALNISVLTASQPSNVSITHKIPSQRELDGISRTFNAAELLEQILLELPATELLFRAQLICKQFCRTIRDTESLKQKMFLASWHKADPQQLPPFKI